MRFGDFWDKIVDFTILSLSQNWPKNDPEPKNPRSDKKAKLGPSLATFETLFDKSSLLSKRVSNVAREGPNLVFWKGRPTSAISMPY